jgi:hypothetical protein
MSTPSIEDVPDDVPGRSHADDREAFLERVSRRRRGMNLSEVTSEMLRDIREEGRE